LTLRRNLTVLNPELLAYATSLSENAEEAKDLVQESAVRALQATAAPKGISDLRPWMFRVIKNLFLDLKRKQRVRREFSDAQQRLSNADRVQVGDAVETLMVRQAFASLSRRDREVLCLVDVLGLRYAEAAWVIGAPAGTVMSRLSRARRAMVERMGESNVRPMRKRGK